MRTLAYLQRGQILNPTSTAFKNVVLNAEVLNHAPKGRKIAYPKALLQRSTAAANLIIVIALAEFVF